MIASPAVTLRGVTDADGPFLRELYASVRAPEFAGLGLDDAALRQLLAMQLAAQDRSYRQAHPEASFDLILHEGQPVGRISVDRGEDTIQLIDIGLLPGARGSGIGGALLRALQDEAAIEGKRVALSVARGNPALSLYRRLGFAVVAEDDMYLGLEWRPPVS